MTINYSTLPGQLATPLVVQDSLRKIWENCTWDDTSSRYPRIIKSAYATDDTEEKDAYVGFANFYDQVAGQIASSWSGHISQIQSTAGLFGILEADLAASDAKDAGGAIEYEHDDNDGQISIKKRSGIWPALADDMTQNRRQLLGSAITIGSLTARSTNRGSLSKVSADAFQHILRGKASGTLILTVDDEDAGAPKLKVQVKLVTPLPDDSLLFEAQDSLQPERTFESGDAGITNLRLDRPGLAAPNKVGDSTNIISSIVVSTPADSDMPGGVFSYRLLNQGGTNPWLVELYSNSAQKASQRVGSKAFAGVSGIQALVIPCRSGTSVALNFDIDLALAGGGIPSVSNQKVGTIDILTPREGDRWEMTIASDQVGVTATKLASIGPISLPVGPAKPGSAATIALAGAGAGNVTNGTHSVKYSYLSALGESEGSASSNVLNVVDHTANGKISVTGIANGPAGTTGKKIYMRIAGDTGTWKYVGTIADNTTTTFTINVADGSLGVDVPIQFDDTLAASISV